MKKYYIALLAAVIALGGCQKAPEETPSGPEPSASAIGTTASDSATTQESTAQKETLALADPSDSIPVPAVPMGYIFKPANDIELFIHEEAAPVLEALGEPLTYLEAPSCAFQGTDRIYGFGSYEITTYEKDGKEYIYDIYFLDDSVTTEEGIYIGCSKEDMEAAYGTEYQETAGSYTYTKDDMTLQFLTEQDTIVAIRYNGAGQTETQ